MSSPETRFEPMTVGRLLDRSFRIYFQNFPLMLGISAFAYSPMLAVQVVEALTAEPGDAVLFPFGFFGVFAFVISFVIVTPIATGATSKAVSDTYLGNPVTVGAALKTAWGRIVPLLLAQLVAGLIITGGFILLFVPGVILSLYFALIAPVAILEKSGHADIRRRSWTLVEGHLGKVFVILWIVVGVVQFVFGLSGNVVLFVTGLEAESGAGAALQVAMQSITTIVGYPLQTIAATLIYYDLRIRKEGFDLEMLSRAVAEPHRQDA